jgi:Homeodomain-like domain
MKPAWQVERALELSDAGWNNCQIARELGLDRRTVSDWVRGRTRLRRPAHTYRNPAARGAGGCPRCSKRAVRIPSYPYAYLLGLYLGDGLLSAHPRDVYRLRVFLDRGHPVIVAECSAAIGLVMPASKVGVVRHRGERMDEVYSFSKHWPHLFPQHGPGRKHEREIELEPWQETIVARHPGRLLRGLIHSDGCRVVNRIAHSKKTYAYPRYFFSNRSLDIQRIFCRTCDRLGVSWRQDGPWNISVARRDAVAIVDRHVGPKR